MNILIVEDDIRVTEFLKENLSKESYSVGTLSSLKELESFIEERPYVPMIFILDRLLGNDDTRSLLKQIKQGFADSYVLFLSALNSANEKATLLEEGADDYLGKPFSLVELQARVKALLRRHSKNGERGQGVYVNAGDLLVDLRQRAVFCQGVKIELTPKEFSLLLNFCENRNKIFTKYQLLDLIWETNLNVESNVIEVNVMNLRKKLEQAKSNLKINSKRNVGYWLEA